MESQRSNNNNHNGSSNNNHNNNNNHHNNGNHRRGSRPSVGYLLFQYQSELTRRHAEPTRLSKTKIHIIDNLVSRTIRHMKHCTVEELQACKRELVYKEQLRDELRSQRRRRSSSSSRNSNYNSNSNTSSSSGSTSNSVASKPIKAPGTPPKPKRVNSKQTTTVTIYGPEIFV